MSAESNPPRTPATGRDGVRLKLIGTGVLLAAIPLTILIVLVGSRWGPLHTLDFDTAADLNRYIAAHPSQLHLWKTVSTVGGPTVLRIVALIGAVMLCFRGQRRTAALVLVTMLGAALLSGITKALVHRPRPVLPTPVDRAGGGSFPSGHALTSFVAMGLLLVVVLPALGRHWQILLWAVAVLLVAAVGFSRTILGVHYLSDVLGGWLVGGAWLLTVVGAMPASGRRVASLS